MQSAADDYQIWREPLAEVEHGGHQNTAVFLKMTDQSQQSMIEAHKNNLPITLHVKADQIYFEITKDTGTEICEVNTVRHNSDETEHSLIYNVVTNKYEQCAQFKGRLQIQATSKSIDQARAKAQKAKEQDTTKTAVKLDITNKEKRKGIPTKPMCEKTQKELGTNKKLSPTMTSRYTGQTLTELNNQPMYLRVLHVVATGKFKSVDEIVKKIKTDSLGKGDVSPNSEFAEKLASIPKILDGMVDKSQKILTLKRELHGQIDKNWKWYTSEERANVRGMLSRRPDTDIVAPTRRSGMYSMSAPSAGSKNAEPIKEIKEPMSSKQPDSPQIEEGEIVDDLPKTPPKKKEYLLTPNTPSEDYTSHFHDIKSVEEYEKYALLYEKEYNEYLNLHNYLKDISKKFDNFQKSLSETSINTKEHEKVLRSVQSNYEHYEKDAEFLRKRQRHLDLRTRLEIVASKIEEWDKREKNKK
uniref:OCEL domain-containing protein n=1 Tax=Parastrongyloides trichosuri TaxID=131310 RepID=A0A0N4ZFI9_PARTI